MKSGTTKCRSHEAPREDKHVAGLRLDKVHITVPGRTWVHEHLCASGPQEKEGSYAAAVTRDDPAYRMGCS